MLQMINMFSDNDIQDSVVISEEYAQKLKNTYIEECNKVSKQLSINQDFINERRKKITTYQLYIAVLGSLTDEAAKIYLLELYKRAAISEEYAQKLKSGYITENKVSKQFANRRKKDMLEAQGGNIIGDLSEETHKIVGRYGDKSIKF